MRFIPLDRVGLLEQALSLEIASGTHARRRNAIAATLGLHGLRVREVCQAAAADFSPTARTLHVRTVKGGKPRDVPLHESLVQAIVAWRRAAELPPGAGVLLPTRAGKPVSPTEFRRFACGLMERLYSERFRFHALRHTFAMRVLVQTDDVLLVKRLLGHRSLASTLVYVEARKQLPDECLVNLDSPFFPRSHAGAQLRIFSPGETG